MNIERKRQNYLSIELHLVPGERLQIKQINLHQVDKVETVFTWDNQRNFAVRRMLFRDFGASVVLNRSHKKKTPPIVGIRKKGFRSKRTQTQRINRSFDI